MCVFLVLMGIFVETLLFFFFHVAVNYQRKMHYLAHAPILSLCAITFQASPVLTVTTGQSGGLMAPLRPDSNRSHRKLKALCRITNFKGPDLPCSSGIRSKCDVVMT